ncbi:MAG: YceI family protein [Bacteroidota bacterium]|nr:YceI family protein [Bacteroidota bacterium]
MDTKTKWIIDPMHSEIAFKVKHLMIVNVKGIFTEYNASIYTTGDDFMTAEVDFWMNPDSLQTKDEKRDAHLRGTDFFDVAHHKEITFTSNTIESVDNDGSYELWGELTIRGITKKIKLDVEFGGAEKDPWGGERAGFTINGKINRKDWELNWNTTLESGGVLVGDTVTISCEVELLKTAES